MSPSYTTDDPDLDKTLCYYIYNNKTSVHKVDEDTRKKIIKYLRDKKGIDVCSKKNIRHPNDLRDCINLNR